MLQSFIVFCLYFCLKLEVCLQEFTEISFELILYLFVAHQDLIFILSFSITVISIYSLERCFDMPDQSENTFLVKLIYAIFYRFFLKEFPTILTKGGLHFLELRIHFLEELDKINDHIISLDITNIHFLRIVNIVEILSYQIFLH